MANTTAKTLSAVAMVSVKLPVNTPISKWIIFSSAPT